MAGVDPEFGTNAFGKAKYKNESQAIANAFLNLLFAKPGFFPSMPKLGLNIQSRLYEFWDEVDETSLQIEIEAQCRTFKEYIDDGSLAVIKSTYNRNPLLLIVVPVQIINTKEHLTIGISTDGEGNVSYNYVFEEINLDEV